MLVRNKLYATLKKSNMSLIIKLSNEFGSQLFRLITGDLFTENQINKITSTTIGKHFADFFPEPKHNLEAKKRIEVAKEHIVSANEIILDIQSELNRQDKQLTELVSDIEEKKKLAQKYNELASISENKFALFKTEMEESLKEQLELKSKEGRRMRQFVQFFIWIITLILGAVLGTFFLDIIDFIKNYFSNI
ncbi:MAG: hypothetical protein ACI976_001484 [Aureispira sp.]|jgi:hypothetical protein